MDLIDGFSKSDEVDSVMVVVNHLSKYAHFIGLKHPFTAHTVVEYFVCNIVCLHGLLKFIVSDRDKVFLSKFWTKLFQLQGTHFNHSTAYHT